MPESGARKGKDAAREAWRVEEDGVALAAFVRSRRDGASWSDVKKLIASGRVLVEGERVVDPGVRLDRGLVVTLADAAPKSRPRGEVRIVHDDPLVVVVDKPAHVSSVPFERGEKGTAMDLVREAWRRMGRAISPLHVVHRIDKDTSGLICYAKTHRAEAALAQQFRRHDVDRTYLCVAHGEVRGGTLVSRLVDDRGDGLRGSTRREGQGREAITHVTALRRFDEATLCLVRLETGRTHQIRIHLAEDGHPIVGERVYVRDFTRAGGRPIDSARLLLHAATLGFAHPGDGTPMRFESELPDDFEDELRRLDRPG